MLFKCSKNQSVMQLIKNYFLRNFQDIGIQINDNVGLLDDLSNVNVSARSISIRCFSDNTLLPSS